MTEYCVDGPCPDEEPIPEDEPVKHGRWTPVTNVRGGFECSICHSYAPSYQNGVKWLSLYCPICGAKMDAEEEARRPRGRWEIHEDASWAGGGFTKCSACGYSYSWGGYLFVDEWPFCPHCGTRMEAQP